MAVFNKNAIESSGQTTIIANGTYIKGEFKLSSILHIDGSIEGDVFSDNAVIIGKNGTVKGTITAQRVVVNGQFFGNVKAEYLELLEGGVIVGDIATQNLSIETGAKFNGKSTLLDSQTPEQIELRNNKEMLEVDASEDI
nr:polymer-forming cytoskeletal protein [Campylobacter sp.]